ncbi:cobyric acid synthase [Halobacteria archaeon AArc-m2/3/4]|uniref:Probable cobyric acid synthase n=1 Tax=Natronoglomus mannanivorans TaxID=2979990 RepID=A0ABT2QJY5_9EURY|nr:cobyric acid synthase [Halobacteria archaeon AArc-m2/3/4]
MIAGTASHVGKSTVAAGLCRLLADRGVAVAPYKAQNMSNNARVVVRSERESGGNDSVHDYWGEIGVSQFVQARAARITPTTDCNPVLLKPRGDGESQLVLDGRALEHLAAGTYYDDHWERARAAAEAAHGQLAAEYDVVIAEGAGSIAEINLHDRDLANVETARFADADVLLLVDIERGGAFASLYGTLELLPADIRDRVVGAAITKFRGDESLLEPGIAEIEARTGVPILGVLPYDDPGLPEEDSVSLPAAGERAIVGADDGVPDERSVTIAVPRLPRISNATDLEVLGEVPGVRIEYVPVDTERGRDARAELATADAVVIPGTKNTVDDLLALRRSGVGDAIVEFDGPIVGLCGGYQLLGERLTNATLEGTGSGVESRTGTETETDDLDAIDGLGLLPVETAFEAEKHLEQVTVDVDGTGPIAGATGTASGYEIHAGTTTVLEPVDRPLGPRSVATADVLGTYLHGLFENDAVREAFLETVFASAGLERPAGSDSGSGISSDKTDENAVQRPYDRAKELVEANLDLDELGFERE